MEGAASDLCQNSCLLFPQTAGPEQTEHIWNNIKSCWRDNILQDANTETRANRLFSTHWNEHLMNKSVSDSVSGAYNRTEQQHREKVHIFKWLSPFHAQMVPSIKRQGVRGILTCFPTHYLTGAKAMFLSNGTKGTTSQEKTASMTGVRLLTFCSTFQIRKQWLMWTETTVTCASDVTRTLNLATRHLFWLLMRRTVNTASTMDSSVCWTLHSGRP